MKKNQSEEPDPVPLVKLLPSLKEYSSLNLNGFKKIIDQLKVKVFSEIEDCYELWEKFSPKESLFDLWDFRYAWYLGYRYKPYFYSLIYKKQILGFIPLWYDPVKKRYEWFGSDWMEDNKFFVVDKVFIPLLIKILPKPYHLNAILPEYSYLLGLKLGLEFDEPKYIFYLEKFKSIDDFLLYLEKKNRYNLKHDYYKILSLTPQVVIDYQNKLENLLHLKQLSEQRFNGISRDWSDFIIKQRFNTYKNIVMKNNIFKTKFIKVYIQKRLAAIDLIITYKDRYYPLKGANDVERFSGMGNFMNYLEFFDAITNGYKIIDCLQGDYNWKNKYYLPLRLLKLESF